MCVCVGLTRAKSRPAGRRRSRSRGFRRRIRGGRPAEAEQATTKEKRSSESVLG